MTRPVTNPIVVLIYLQSRFCLIYDANPCIFYGLAISPPFTPQTVIRWRRRLSYTRQMFYDSTVFTVERGILLRMMRGRVSRAHVPSTMPRDFNVANDRGVTMDFCCCCVRSPSPLKGDLHPCQCRIC